MEKTVLVTGASGGIGGAVAKRLATDGFSVIAHYSGSSEKADEVVTNIKQAGGNAIALPADISKPTEVRKLFQDGRSALGPFYAVVNTAGIMPLAPIAKGDIDAFDKVIATNLRGSYLIMSEAANEVAEGGRVVLFSSSVVAKNGRLGQPDDIEGVIASC